MRSGTENTPGIAGFGLAAEIGHNNLRERILAMGKARNYLLEGMKAEIPDIRINSPEAVFGDKEVGSEPKAEAETNTKESIIPVASPGILNVSFWDAAARCCSTPWSSGTSTCPPARLALPRKREVMCWRRRASPPRH